MSSDRDKGAANTGGRAAPPPTISGLGATSARPGASLEISGANFGSARGRVTFRLNAEDAPTVDAATASWSPRRIVAVVPTLAALGSGGLASVVVATAAGSSSPAVLSVLEPEPPQITDVSPKKPMPGDELRIAGRGFGLAPFGVSQVLFTTAGGEKRAEIRTWASDEIRVPLPPLGTLGGAGTVSLQVRTPWGTSPARLLTLGQDPTLSPLPVALLPVRLETRYAAGGAELRVRIYPDEIAVHAHEPKLTEAERASAQAYQQAPPEQRETLWRDLVARFGAGRAEWLARVPADVNHPGYPGSREAVWTLPPRTRVMPTRWYAFGYKDGERVFVRWGREIPDEIKVGPDPREFGVSVAEEGAPVDEGMKWMVDFEDAVDLGMALRIQLPPEARGRLDKLVVLGVKEVPGGGSAGGHLAELLAAHRYTRGLGFLEAGTPTNNTRDDTTGLDPAAVPPPVAPGGAAFTSDDGSNRDVVARALGLDESVFAGISGAADGKVLNDGRRAMNTALWPATWGYFLEQMLAPVLDAAAIDTARKHFVDWVRACGPMPALQVGDQPYGLLVATPLELWQGRPGDAPAGLVDFIKRARAPWRASISQVPRVGRTLPEEGGESQNLLATLAMQPTSVSYRGRFTLGERYVDAAWRFLREGLSDEWWDNQEEMARSLLDLLGIGGSPRVERATFASNYFRFDGPAVERDPETGGAQPPTANYLAWLSGPGRPGYRAVRDEAFEWVAELQPSPYPLLYLLVRHGLLLEYLGAAAITASEEELVGVDEFETNLAAPRPLTPWDHLASGGRGALLDGVGRNESEFGEGRRTLGAYLQGLHVLSGLPVRTLERLLAETLDLCSHRLDAWATSIASRRLDAVRRDPTKAAGVHLAGWGAVFDLEPDQEQRESRGFVHAPSSTHAATAAMLAGGYLSHADDGGDANPLAIDLSSARLRLALGLLDGVRRGHSLGTLLGYRFERGLHERGLREDLNLDQYVDDFRKFAPLPTGAEEPSSGGAIEAIAAHNVVDGLELHRRWVAAGRPSDGLPSGWPTVGPEHLAAVADELATLDDAVDAVGDALLSESVFQSVRGNPARAAAALDAAAGKGAPSAELEVAQTPHGGIGLTHKLLLVLPEGPLPRTEWGKISTPRVAAEPRLDAWAAGLLGDPKRVVFDVEYVDAQSGEVLERRPVKLHQLEPALSPLDVLYAAEAHDEPQRSELEQRFLFHAARTKPENVPADALVRPRTGIPSGLPHDVGLLEFMEAARAGREAIAAARSLTAADLSIPESPATATVRVAELAGRARAANAALRSAANGLESAVGAGTTEGLRSGLLAAARFGVAGAVPRSAVGDSEGERSVLEAQAASVLEELRRRVTQAASALEALDLCSPTEGPEECRDLALQLINAVFGPAFKALPLFTLDGAADPTRLDMAFGRSGELTGRDPLAATTWLQRAARVRDGARRLADALAYAEALGERDTMRLAVAQLPARPGDRWVALPFEGEPSAGRVSFAASLPLGAPAVGQAFVGLLIDEWAEILPSAEETTAVAFHFDAPGASAPQAIVLAVPPREENWTLDALEATVLETLELAQLRMVDLDALQGAGHFLPAIQLALNLRGATVATDLKGGTGCPIR